MSGRSRNKHPWPLSEARACLDFSDEKQTHGVMTGWKKKATDCRSSVVHAPSLKWVMTACLLGDKSASVFMSSPRGPLVFTQSYSRAVKVVTVNTLADSLWLIQMTQELQLCGQNKQLWLRWTQIQQKNTTTTKKKDCLEEQKSIQAKETTWSLHVVLFFDIACR